MKTIIRDREHGAVAPLVAILMVVFILCVALVVDLGHLHNVKVHLQRAVDAAALAGAQQLSGVPGQDDNATNVAKATAAINRVDNITDGSWVNSTSLVIELGTWDLDITATDRFSTPVATDTGNAIKVTATFQADNFFYIFSGTSTVTADAIAVAAPKSPVLPLAIITCVPADKMLENPGSLPGLTACDIASYDLASDQDDTMAWTSLTFGANANDISDYMNDVVGVDKFNKVIFGRGLANTDGIENESVDYSLSGCYPHDFDIPCGLGQIGGEDIAPPGAFPIPGNISALSGTPGVPASGFDPLIDYGTNGALPRWYNINTADENFDSDDHFTRVWSQDGILVPGAGESAPDFVARLKTYAECSNPTDPTSTCSPYKDTRFHYDKDEYDFITHPTGQPAQNLLDSLGFIPEYWPNYKEVFRQAGYPKVGVINGKTQTVLDAFIANRNVSDGTDLICSDNTPLPAGQKTLRINAPVIFAGACEDWKAISGNPVGHSLTYVGLSKFLLTRAWIRSGTEGSYDCGEVDEVVRVPGGGCPDTIFDPPLDGIYFSVDGITVSADYRGLEGLSTVPTPDGEEDQGSILSVFLVE